MRTAVHGMPRIGKGRALKWALEGFWAGRLDAEALETEASAIRRRNWQILAEAGVDLIPSNDFSLYDHVLDAALMVGAVPARFRSGDELLELDRYFALARGGDMDGRPVAPLELTKWFDTNYHHLVTVLDSLVDTYAEVLAEVARQGAVWVRLDEPVLVEDRTDDELAALRRAYRRLSEQPGRPSIVVSTYFGHVGSAMTVLADLPVEGVGLDFCRGQENLALLSEVDGLDKKVLFAGVVDGRNVWANDLDASLDLLERLTSLCDEVVVSTSCSLLHVPLGLGTEGEIDDEVRPWLAFAEEKLGELAVLSKGATEGRAAVAAAIQTNRAVLEARNRSPRVRDAKVRRAMASTAVDPQRSPTFEERVEPQRTRLGLPLLPTTTIGSFPQTVGLRAARAAWRAGRSGDDEYRGRLRFEIDRVVALQEELGLDVILHGEPERDDMVRYFAAQLTRFVLPQDGWVQSYGFALRTAAGAFRGRDQTGAHDPRVDPLCPVTHHEAG